ncbi:MAG TPA: TolC family protein [Bacteroidales bacterium]|nr:TolC family protein [Bacteroidales bacterium]
MNRTKNFLFTGFLLVTSQLIFSQPVKKVLSLDQVISIAKDQSLQAIMAKHRFRSSYWEYRTYVAKFRPSLNLNATLPDFNHTISLVTVKGGNTYTEINDLNNSLKLSLNQNIGLTGGSIFIESQLGRLDRLTEDTTNYSAQPISIGFQQPINGFNSLKWEKKIEPLKYKEAKETYIRAMENVAVRAVDLFFNLAQAQLNIRIANVNFENADTLYKIAQGRYNIGTIAENELLQMELGKLNAGTAVNEGNIDLEEKKNQIRSFLGYNDQVDISLVIPVKIPDLEMNVDKAYSQALQNNPDIIQMDRQLIEAKRDVAQAKSEKGLKANLYASYGLSKQDAYLDAAYQNPKNQQVVQVGLQMPIIDWGLGRGRYKMAESSQDVVRTQVEQNRIDFQQNIFLQVMRFNLQDDQLMIAAKADTIAQLRYDVTKQRFLIGKIDVLDLNVAQSEKDVAKRGYISALRNYWNYFYTLRQITLYDFISDKPLDTDFDQLLK